MAEKNVSLENLIRDIEDAVVKAAYAVQTSNLEILESYFVKVKDADGNDIPQDEREKSLNASEQPLNIFELPEFGGTYAPKTIAIQYPIMNPQAQKAATLDQHGVPIPEKKVIHTVYVPLISLVPPATYYVDEVTVRMNAEIQLDPDGQEMLVFFSSQTTTQNAEKDRPEGLEADATVKIVVKRGEDSATKTEVIRGYDRATRAEIPG